jgi:nicotinamidase-related amidase
LSVVFLRRPVPSQPSEILVLVDLQDDLLSDYSMCRAEADAALKRCREALSYARGINLPVAFTRRLQPVQPLNGDREQVSQWIAEFRPRGSEMVFEHARPSCYDSKYFHEAVMSFGGQIVLAGLAGATACLATAIDAHHRGHRVRYLSDASASPALGAESPQDIHRVTEQMAALYGEVLTVAAWMRSAVPITSLRS